MKKIIAVLTLFLAISIHANAQDTNSNMQLAAKAKADYNLAEQKLKLKGETQQQFYDILLSKHTALADNPKMTAEEKNELVERIKHKLKKVLSKGQYNYFGKDPELLDRLVH